MAGKGHFCAETFQSPCATCVFDSLSLAVEDGDDPGGRGSLAWDLNEDDKEQGPQLSQDGQAARM